MTNPLATWDDDNSGHDDLVWWARLDQRWQIEVHRTGDYLGTLHIFDHTNENKLVYSEEVTLAYDAVFGPDVGDVALWQEKVMTFVDNLPG